MAAKFIDGRRIAESIRDGVRWELEELQRLGAPVCLVTVLIGEDPASQSYAQSQARAAESVGIAHRRIELRPGVSTDAAIADVRRLNLDPAVSGIVVQLPVPATIDAFALQQAIAPEKDVEGVSATSLGRLLLGRDCLSPCTAAAAMECVRSTGVDLAGKHAVVVGRSGIVGKPVAALLLAANATVTQCHSRTISLPTQTQRADVLVVAAGRAGFIGREHVSPGAIVIDVGTNSVTSDDGKHRLVGDVRTDEVCEIASWITPVPGGVGPVTVAMLLANLAKAAKAAAGR